MNLFADLPSSEEGKYTDWPYQAIFPGWRNDGTASVQADGSRRVDAGQAGSFVTSVCKSGYNAASALTPLFEQRQGACTQTPEAFYLTDLVRAKDSRRRRTSMSLAS
ncbi:hypothetical protein CXB41_03185 [Pseudomonas syringae pv. syringae]|nr:hypothetical protein CXB41_03185 [Pseudomonas syringae pv. syringae]